MFFRKRAQCGHLAPRSAYLTAFGEKALFHIPWRLWINPFAKPNHCPSCFEKIAVACAICGKPIWPYNAVSILLLKRNKLPAGAIELASRDPNKDEVEAICCMRDDCGDRKLRYYDFAGHWVPPGEFKQFDFN